MKNSIIYTWTRWTFFTVLMWFSALILLIFGDYPPLEIFMHIFIGFGFAILDYLEKILKVLDKASGKVLSYKESVINGDIGTMVEERKR